MVAFARLYETAVSCAHSICDSIPICESEFTTLLPIETNSGNRLNAKADIRVAIGNIVKRFQKLP